MKPAMVMLAFALMTGSAEAQKDTFTVVSPTSCGGWTAHRRDNTADVPEFWVLGFLSGAAAGSWASPARLDPLNGVDAEGVWAWIDNYCRTHPLDSLVNAAVMFLREHPR